MPDANPRPLKVFICHASQDKPKVRELYQRLKAEGWIDPWLDVAKILPGQHWTSVIRQSLADADAIIIFVSCNSISKEGFVQREMNYAWDLSLEKPRSVIFLIPLRLEECEVPYDLRERQWADYFGEKQEDTYAALLQSLKLRHTQVLRLDAEMQARKEAEESARREREELEKIASEEKARLEAKDRARKDAEEKARKEKEAQDKKAAEDLKRKQDEENARLAKEARERKAAEEQAKKQVEQPKLVKVVEPRREPVVPVTQKQPRKIDFRWWGIGGAILLVLFCVVFGIYYLVKNWPLIPVSTATFTPSRTPTKPVATFTPSRTPTPTVVLIPTPKAGDTWERPADKMVMVYVPEGNFLMGSTDADITQALQLCPNCDFNDEKPQHTVTLDAFWIDQTEVTNKMYALCVAAGKCDPPSSNASNTHQDYYGNSQYDDYPVIYVSWNDATAYCAWGGGSDITVRLPTEAEWEKAARGTDGRTYPWGEGIDCTKANYYDGSKYCVGDTSAVGSYGDGISPYGVYDMAGNVWEWVSDWYDAYPGNTVSDSTYGTKYRVLRGGSWDYYDVGARSAYRDGYGSTHSYVSFGFRCSHSK